MNDYYRDEYKEEGSTSSLTKAKDDEPCVYVVLLNWNGWRDTVECLHSFESMRYSNWQPIIVDNGSTDDSVKQLRNAFPATPLIENGKNLGFAAGNNVGIRFALKGRADYVFVLNNDTTVFPDTLPILVRFAECHPKAALMGPRIDRRDAYKEWPVRRQLSLLTILCTYSPLRRLIARLPLIRAQFYYTGNKPAPVCFLAGSALFFNVATFQATGLFDEATFLDFEEIIMAEKVRKMGLSLYFIPGAIVHHKGSISSSKLRARRYVENAKSEQYFLSTYSSLSGASRWLVRSVRLITYSVRALLYKNYRDHFVEFVAALLSR